MENNNKKGLQEAFNKQQGKTQIQKSLLPPAQPILTIIHFNDVYDIQPKGGSMGVCNFKAKVEALRQKYPKSLLLFSGDCFSPSNFTNFKKGWQMVYALNTLKIDCACFGNHQFDFPRNETLDLAKACNFPFLLGNITYIQDGNLLGDGLPYIVKEWEGHRIGIMGIAGDDWIGILSDEYQGELQHEDSIQFANRTFKYLRQKEKCDIVIALTHMRNDADRNLPLHVEGIDLMLGGHDHVILTQVINQTAVIKSGSNFNNVGLIKLYHKDVKTNYQGRRFNYQWQIFKITSTANVDLKLKKYVDDLTEEYSKFDEVIGYSDVDLQTRFQVIRLKQANYGNFMVDLARKYYDTDIAAINAGSIRNDTVIPAGKLTYAKISNIINSPLVVKKITGQVILEMLEYSVAATPEYSGAFLIVSGLSFEYDWNKKPKIINVNIGEQKLNLHNHYTITTTFYQARGGDGYEMLKNNGEIIVDEIKAITTLSLLLKFFRAPDSHQEYESLKLAKSESKDIDINIEEQLKLVRKPSVRIGRIKELRSRYVLDEQGKKLTCIAPVTDGRIKCLNDISNPL